MVLAGLTPDGGLYIPESILALPADWHTSWCTHSFTDLAVAVLSLYISPDEIPLPELCDLVERSYTGFRHPAVTPLRTLDGGLSAGRRSRSRMSRCSCSATCSRVLPRTTECAGNGWRGAGTADGGERDERRYGQVRFIRGSAALRGTNTGSSASVYGLRGKVDIEIFILHPKGRVLPIQKA